MKKFLIGFVACIMIAPLALGLSACKKKKPAGGDNGGGEVDPPVVDTTKRVKEVELDPRAATLEPGETLTVEAIVTVENDAPKTVNWTSSDESVVTGAAGLITAISVGQATITAKATFDSEKLDTCYVTVIPAVVPYGKVADAPENLALSTTATTQGVSATLTWQDPEYTGETWSIIDGQEEGRRAIAITGYKISLDNGASWINNPGVTKTTDEVTKIVTVTWNTQTLVNGQTYNIKVRAINAIGESLDALLPPEKILVAPTKPQNLAMTTNGNAVTLTWATADLSITEYQVVAARLGVAPDWAQAKTTAQKTYTFDGDKFMYYGCDYVDFYVRAVNEIATGAYEKLQGQTAPQLAFSKFKDTTYETTDGEQKIEFKVIGGKNTALWYKNGNSGWELVLSYECGNTLFIAFNDGQSGNELDEDNNPIFHIDVVGRYNDCDKIILEQSVKGDYTQLVGIFEKQ
jgi:hypothetical protein